MDRQWSREHDRRIAERVEDWKVIELANGKLVRSIDHGPIPEYNTDTLRAIDTIEKWRKQSPDRRTWHLSSGARFFACEANDGGRIFGCDFYSETMAEALAWVVWDAARRDHE